MTTTYEKASKYLRELPAETLFSAAIRTAPQFVRNAVCGNV
jgi:hypothetical protein